MQKLPITTALLIFAFSAANAESAREKVLIFNLSIIHEKSVLVEKHKKGKKDEERFDYYSLIIPHTIAKNLNASGNVEAQKIDGVLPLGDIGSDDFYARMGTLAARHAAGYLLGGKGTIRGKKLTLELALVDVRGKDFTAITKETFETGAEMRNIISDLSADIEQKLAASMRKSRPPAKEAAALPEEKQEEIPPAEEEQEPLPAEKEKRIARVEEQQKQESGPVPVSPFLKMYRALDGVSFGIRAGSFFIKGTFTKLYEDSEYVSPYLRYGILGWLGVSAEADYIAAGNGGIQARKMTSLALWGITLNADFTWWLFSHFGLRLTAGAGISHGRLYLWGSDNPFGGLNKQARSTDPYLNIAASAIIQFQPVELSFGGAYKSAFFRGRTLTLLTVFFGIGYHL